MKRTIILLLLSVFLVSVISCKKYDDGPTFSLASKKHRLIGVPRVIEKVEMNGVDMTEAYKAHVNYIEFRFAGDFTYSSVTETIHGTWEFDDKKENLLLKRNDNPNVTYKWEIKRLTQKDLWVRLEAIDGSGDILDTQFTKK